MEPEDLTPQEENSIKLIETFQASNEEWGMLWGVLRAQHEIPELKRFYDNILIAKRIDELKNKMLEDL